MMKIIALTLLGLIIIVFLLAILLGVIRSNQVKNKPVQKDFVAGKIPQPMPDGFYKGHVAGLDTTWQGKQFDAAKNTGINVFKNGDKTEQKYSFKTYVGYGVQDPDISVLKIDYSDNKHPWWLKFILDEVVEVAPNKLLGKVHITFIPGLPFTVGFFELKKN